MIDLLCLYFVVPDVWSGAGRQEKKKSNFRSPVVDEDESCFLLFSLTQDSLQILFRCRNGHDIEILHQDIKNIGADKGRQTGP